ncbi:sulfite exporter TauE/SafE family protein [Paralimibaculum aggregatum]|uniref:Probable membrane transporter protein n=1 Tax=Paralimibaculum aggregatum TaxID=3036245 RepID=A0ABQ6LHN8_9RHOB|nr:sulfite exporter TauE/SafE family protein [Limibaculum sp. NKW23]GMG81740.1 sulfite exporter TauE/SafE family protein [Limibaculum sp. NKW23]
MNLPDGVDPAALATVLAIFFGGGIVKGGLGFGLPLATMSMLPLVIPVDMALAINVIVQPATNLGQLIAAENPAATMRRFAPVCLTMAVGVAIGTAFVTGLDPESLTLLLGVFVTAFCLISLRGVSLPIPPRRERPAGLAVGLLAGAIGALTTASGPILVIYLLGLGVDRREFRAAIGFLFIVSGAMIVGGFWSVGFLDWSRAGLALLCMVPTFLGMAIGNRLARRLPPEGFRTAVLIGLSCLGANFLMRGLGVL